MKLELEILEGCYSKDVILNKEEIDMSSPNTVSMIKEHILSIIDTTEDAWTLIDVLKNLMSNSDYLIDEEYDSHYCDQCHDYSNDVKLSINIDD